jgi:hypothetical protein
MSLLVFLREHRLIVLVAVPLVLIPLLFVLMKAYGALLEKLMNETALCLEKSLARRQIKGARGQRFLEISLEVCMAVIVFSLFFHIYTAPVFLFISTHWPPALYAMFVWWVFSFVSAGLTTYKIMQMIHRHFRLGNHVTSDKQDG